MQEADTVYFSRFAFIFLVYVVITSGYINKTLSCQMREFLSNTQYGQHVMGLVMVFVFVMLEGGWSFDEPSEEDAGNNWSSGNVLHTMMMAAAIYIIFVISSKSRLVPNFIFFALVFVLYLINTQRAYWLARKKITQETSDALVKVQIGLVVAAFATLSYGFIDYVLYQQASYGSKFSWPLFLVGSPKCSSFE